MRVSVSVSPILFRQKFFSAVEIGRWGRAMAFSMKTAGVFTRTLDQRQSAGLLMSLPPP
jgi:hypothetical protein